MNIRNGSVKRVLCSVIAIMFFVNNLAYGLAPGVVSGELRPDGDGVKGDMYAAGQKLFAAKRGPGAIDFDSYIAQKDFTGKVPQVTGVKFVPANHEKGLPKGWENNPLLRSDLPDLINALKYFRDSEANLADVYDIREGYFDVDSQSGELPISRWEFNKLNNKWVLVVHADFIKMWNDIKNNDIWFEHSFPNGEKRTVSLAWAIFYRVAKHEMVDLKRHAPNVVLPWTIFDEGQPKGGGHMVRTAGTESARVEESEETANKIGGRYALVNDALWMWFLGSYAFGASTQRNNDILKERLTWFFEDKEAQDMKLNLEFPNFLKDDAGRALAIDLALAVNHEFYKNYKETPVGQYEAERLNRLKNEYDTRKDRISGTMPATGAETLPSRSPELQKGPFTIARYIEIYNSIVNEHKDIFDKKEFGAISTVLASVYSTLESLRGLETGSANKSDLHLRSQARFDAIVHAIRESRDSGDAYLKSASYLSLPQSLHSEIDRMNAEHITSSKPADTDKLPGGSGGLAASEGPEAGGRPIEQERVEPVTATVTVPQEEVKSAYEVIEEYVARIAAEKGPGAIPELSSKELRAVWDMVGLLHDSRIEILLPRNIKLTESMKKALADIRKRDGGDVIKCREYTDADHLGKMLGQAPDAGTKRIVVTETSLTDAVIDLATADPQLFKEVRLYNTTLPKDYDSMSQVEKTVCQARAINIAILMRLFEKEKTPMVEMLLRIALTGRLDDGVGMDDFINKIAEGDPAYTLQRILWFLGKTVKLVEQLGKELRLLKEVWTAA